MPRPMSWRRCRRPPNASSWGSAIPVPNTKSPDTTWASASCESLATQPGRAELASTCRSARGAGLSRVELAGRPHCAPRRAADLHEPFRPRRSRRRLRSVGPGLDLHPRMLLVVYDDMDLPTRSDPVAPLEGGGGGHRGHRPTSSTVLDTREPSTRLRFGDRAIRMRAGRGGARLGPRSAFDAAEEAELAEGAIERAADADRGGRFREGILRAAMGRIQRRPKRRLSRPLLGRRYDARLSGSNRLSSPCRSLTMSALSGHCSDGILRPLAMAVGRPDDRRGLGPAGLPADRAPARARAIRESGAGGAGRPIAGDPRALPTELGSAPRHRCARLRVSSPKRGLGRVPRRAQGPSCARA